MKPRSVSSKSAVSSNGSVVRCSAWAASMTGAGVCAPCCESSPGRRCRSHDCADETAAGLTRKNVGTEVLGRITARDRVTAEHRLRPDRRVAAHRGAVRARGALGGVPCWPRRANWSPRPTPRPRHWSARRWWAWRGRQPALRGDGGGDGHHRRSAVPALQRLPVGLPGQLPVQADPGRLHRRLATDILVSQVARMLGIRVPSSAEFFEKLATLVTRLGAVHWWSVAVSVFSLAILIPAGGTRRGCRGADRPGGRHRGVPGVAPVRQGVGCWAACPVARRCWHFRG